MRTFVSILLGDWAIFSGTWSKDIVTILTECTLFCSPNYNNCKDSTQTIALITIRCHCPDTHSDIDCWLGRSRCLYILMERSRTFWQFLSRPRNRQYFPLTTRHICRWNKGLDENLDVEIWNFLETPFARWTQRISFQNASPFNVDIKDQNMKLVQKVLNKCSPQFNQRRDDIGIMINKSDKAGNKRCVSQYYLQFC